jgi:hypothetical protein
VNVERTIAEHSGLSKSLNTFDSFNWRGNLLNKDIGGLSRRHRGGSHPQSATTSELVGACYGRAGHSEAADYDTGQENDNNSRYGREEEGIQVPARNLPDGA